MCQFVNRVLAKTQVLADALCYPHVTDSLQLQPLGAYSKYCIICYLLAIAMTKRSVASESNKLHFQVQVPDSFSTLGSTSSRPSSSSTTTPNRVPMPLNITLTSEDNVDLLKRSISAHVHEYTGIWRPPSTFQLVQNQRHIRFWEPLANFAVNEPIQVIITQLAIRSPSESLSSQFRSCS